MPRILIYEECLAAGSQGPLGDEAQRFLPEGLAMTLAVAEDFAKLPGWTVHVLRAAELRTLTPEDVAWQWIDVPGGLDSMLASEAAAADWTLVIAPECGGLLQQRAQAVVDAGGKLLGPGPEFIALASDKTATLQVFAEAVVSVPRGVQGTLAELEQWTGPFPAVVKPNDGVGASGVRRVDNRDTLLTALRELAELFPTQSLWRCEEFILGQAASVAILAGRVSKVLRAVTQTMEYDQHGQAQYQGGALALSDQRQTRARNLGANVALLLPRSQGYYGIDMVLGNAEDGSQDTLIEVNPRLTTSYIGLRHATHQSLADAMWRVAQGETVNIAWLPNIVEFTKQGQVTTRDR